MPIDPALINRSVRQCVRIVSGLATDELKGMYRRRVDGPPTTPEERAAELEAEGEAALAGGMSTEDEMALVASIERSRGGRPAHPGGSALSAASGAVAEDAAEEREGAEGEAAADAADAADAEDVDTPALPRDLYSHVLGLDREKRVLRTAITGRTRPRLHLYIDGPPGTAKSLLLNDTRRVARTQYLDASNLTPRGLSDIFLTPDGRLKEHHPTILLLDELPRAKAETQNALLVIMDGTVSRGIMGQAVALPVDILIIGAGNGRKGMSPALLSRLHVILLTAYSDSELREVIVANLCSSRNDIGPDAAREIAEAVVSRGGDTRDADQLAAIWVSDPQLARDRAESIGPRRSPAARITDKRHR